MFSVIFEVHPRPEQWDNYLDHARMLKPGLERIDGFVDNIRYRSLTRAGWILSLSGWRDEKALVRWRTATRHHEAQVTGRSTIFLDYHLRVGQVTRDNRIPEGQVLREQRLDETEVGAATIVSLIDAPRTPAFVASATPDQVAESLGFAPGAEGLVSWDVFDAVLTPGNVIVLASWTHDPAAAAFEAGLDPNATRVRRIRIVRDYGMFDRREAPQHYPDAAHRADRGQPPL